MAVNGIEIVRYKDEDPARLRRGPIGLQIHSGASVVEYKDIEVEVDPKDDDQLKNHGQVMRRAPQRIIILLGTW